MSNARKNALIVAIAASYILMLVGVICTQAHCDEAEDEAAALSQRVNELEADKAVLSCRVIDADGDLAAAQERIKVLEAEVEALTARFEDVSFGYDEVCEATGWNEIHDCTITGYCACPACCGQWSGGPTSSGAMPVQGVTVAVDTSVIPMGAQVMIEGDETVYTAQDTGVSGNWIDKFYASHADALAWGLQHRTVYWRAA